MPGGRNPYDIPAQKYVPPAKGQPAPRNPVGTPTYTPIKPGSNGGGGAGANDAPYAGSTGTGPVVTNTYGATGDYTYANGSTPGGNYANAFTPNFDLNSINPSSDYAYQAFLKGAGYSDSLAKAQAARANASLQAQLAAAEPAFDQQLARGLTNDNNNFAARGGVRSSARLLQQADTQNNVNTQRANFEGGIANQQAGIQNSLESALANSRIQQTQQDLAARQRLLDQQNQLGQNAYATQNAQALLTQLLGG